MITYGLVASAKPESERRSLAAVDRLGEDTKAGVVVGLQDREGGVGRRVVDGDDLADERRVEDAVDDLLDRLSPR